MAIMVSNLINVQIPKGKPKTKPEDFIPKFGRERPEASMEAMLRMVESLNAAFGGQDLRKGAGG